MATQWIAVGKAEPYSGVLLALPHPQIDGPYRPAAAPCPRGDGHLWEGMGLKDVCWQCEDGEGDYHADCDDRRIGLEFAMIGFSNINGVLLLAINQLDLDKTFVCFKPEDAVDAGR